ncbi:MAG: 2,4-dihydroxyhept-2-ene-1,7-dioic acid aldolase [Armatimonadota bacterium]|nr:2,4-dihydroxyhept-2-ene-1,7-dioic acid aldolase [Armatimonadota bacterium]MDR7439937.1 2,4-dihydroxyhept-2-ene-1,7-dioic acid aldolase [Armatimonadota bacterium]MDR7567866.1 2,4-dihydroxyhept-2-ene-1,7-dioic acid aldolase [Armatimonadota bacterium]
MNLRRLRGSIVPLVTPFRNGRLDEKALQGLIEWQIASGSHGISVGGTTGEATSLTLKERERLIRVAVETAAGRVPVVAGVGTNHHEEALFLIRRAEQLGADALLVLVPYHVRPTQQGLYEHFRAVARATELPVIVYNIPGRTAVNLEVETLARLRQECPNLVGVKEANRDFEHVNRVLYYCGRDFLLYSGIELLCYPMLAIGGAGSISATANLVPDRVARMHDLWFAGDWQGALTLHYELLPLNDILFVETNPGPLKYALGLLGKIVPEIRLPLVLPSEENQRRIRRVLQRYGLLDGESGRDV